MIDGYLLDFCKRHNVLMTIRVDSAYSYVIEMRRGNFIICNVITKEKVESSRMFNSIIPKILEDLKSKLDEAEERANPQK